MTTNIGVYELRDKYSSHIIIGLIIAACAHFSVTGGYRLYSHLTNEVISFPRLKGNTVITVIPLPPSVEYRDIIPLPVVGVRQTVSIGVPVPVPVSEIHPDATIATQKEMNRPLTGAEFGDPNGNVLISDNTTVNSDEPPPPFVPVEKQPEPVNKVFPHYPEIARRAGVEGTVHVNMWVTKDGRVQQAIVVRTTHELFNQPALDAALQWTFTPAIMNNGPVAVWVTVPFRFRLNTR
jgi:protein TonB